MKRNILFFIMFSVLIGLGSWQLYRLDYKNSLINEIKENSHIPPVKVSTSDLNDKMYRNISIRGELHDSKTIFYYRLKNNKPGYEVITPLVLDTGNTLLLSRGWVKEQSYIRGTKNVHVQGYLIGIYKSNIGSPKNDVKKNTWFDLDSGKLKDHKNITNVLPFMLLLESPKELMIGEKGLGFDIYNLSNNHLGYAITWFTLAVLLLIIFLVDFKNRGRDERL